MEFFKSINFRVRHILYHGKALCKGACNFYVFANSELFFIGQGPEAVIWSGPCPLFESFSVAQNKENRDYRG